MSSEQPARQADTRCHVGLTRATLEALGMLKALTDLTRDDSINRAVQVYAGIVGGVRDDLAMLRVPAGSREIIVALPGEYQRLAEIAAKCQCQKDPREVPAP